MKHHDKTEARNAAEATAAIIDRQKIKTEIVAANDVGVKVFL